MQSYTLYFSLFDYKMKTTVEADSLDEAKQIVRNRIVFYDNVPKAEPRRHSSDPTVNHLKNIFGMFD